MWRVRRGHEPWGRVTDLLDWIQIEGKGEVWSGKGGVIEKIRKYVNIEFWGRGLIKWWIKQFCKWIHSISVVCVSRKLSLSLSLTHTHTHAPCCYCNKKDMVVDFNSGFWEVQMDNEGYLSKSILCAGLHMHLMVWRPLRHIRQAHGVLFISLCVAVCRK